jgi:hypothetical protein
VRVKKVRGLFPLTLILSRGGERKIKIRNLCKGDVTKQQAMGCQTENTAVIRKIRGCRIRSGMTFFFSFPWTLRPRTLYPASGGNLV